MASLLRRARPPRGALLFVVLWGSVVAGSVALSYPPTQGFVASAFFVVAASALLRYREGREGAPALAVVLAAVGLGLGALPFEPLRAVADGVVAAAVIVVLTVLYHYAAEGRRAPALDRRTLPAGASLVRDRARALTRSLLRRFDDATWRRLPVFGAGIALVLCIAVALGGATRGQGWRLVGGPHGPAVWNAAFFDASLRRDGRYLRDDDIAAADGASPRVGIADSPVLTAAKAALPNHWTGPQIANLLAILDLAALLWCAVLFVAELSGTTGGAAIAVIAALLVTPLLRQVGATAPLDLWPALAIATLSIRRPSVPLVVAGAVLGLLNVAGGDELAVLAAGLGLARRIPARFAWSLAIAGLAGSTAGALVSAALAPDATSSALWWSSNAIVRLVRTSGVGWPWGLAVVAAAAIVASWIWSFLRNERAARDAALAAAVTLVLALPGLLGGVPLLVPARLLDVVPLGWPTARILALTIVLLAVPVALAVRTLLRHAGGSNAARRATALIALIAVGCALTLPAAPSVILPPLPLGSVAVELPVAESGSRASFVFADDLLERGSRIVQPVPYVVTRTPLSGGDGAELAMTSARKQSRPAFIVLRIDVYADPLQRFAEPTVVDAADYAVPALSHDPTATLSSLTDQARVYRLTP